MKNKQYWYSIDNQEEVNSPAILVYPDRIENNIRKMIEMAGGTARLRPHVKTHKMPEIVKLQLKSGIKKFKCSTIAEVEMTASAGARDILFAMQPVGPNLRRFFNLRKQFPEIYLSCIADNPADIDHISEQAKENNMRTDVWLDINPGMNRTGIAPGREAELLFIKISNSPMLSAAGLHVYDGDNHESDPDKRQKITLEVFKPVTKMIKNLEKQGFGTIAVIAGGTPTFPVHASLGTADLSPGTLLLWDYGYSRSFRDLEFEYAAVLLTRIISKPASGLLCLDLGHKAVASEMPHPRVFFPEVEQYRFSGHNEEHMVIETPEAGNYATGDVLYAIPWHVCPTVDRHDIAYVVRNNHVTEEWDIAARKRKLTI